jgi:hypothetical protein
MLFGSAHCPCIPSFSFEVGVVGRHLVTSVMRLTLEQMCMGLVRLVAELLDFT